MYGVTKKEHPKIKSWNDMDQDGIVIATQLGSYVDSFMKTYLKKAKVLSVQPPATREGEVAAGRADILMTDYPVAKKLEATQDWAKIINPAEPLAVTPYAYVVAPGDQVWLNYINLFVKTIKRDGRLLNAAKKNRLEPVVNLNGAATPSTSSGPPPPWGGGRLARVSRASRERGAARAASNKHPPPHPSPTRGEGAQCRLLGVKCDRQPGGMVTDPSASSIMKLRAGRSP